MYFAKEIYRKCMFWNFRHIVSYLASTILWWKKCVCVCVVFYVLLNVSFVRLTPPPQAIEIHRNHS